MAPKGADHSRDDDALKVNGAPVGLKLTPEQIAALNAVRRPSERVGDTAICGARLSLEAIERKRLKGKDVSNPVCELAAGSGTVHPKVGYCKWHGGNTESGIKSAARLVGQAFIEKRNEEMTRFGGDKTLVQVTPEEAILEEVRRGVAMVRFLEEAISQWQFQARHPGQPVPLGGLPTLVDETGKGNATFTDEREWLLLYRQEREHTVKTAKLAIDAGIANRLVTIAEDQGRTLAIAIRMVLDAMDLTPEQIERVPRIVPGILRQVTAGTPMPQPITA